MKDSITPLRSLSVEELIGAKHEEEATLIKLRHELASGELKNHRAVRKARIRMARIETLLRERER
ncbi:MAG: 50S ribosomal protein L29 [Parcubacteria group bacterium]|nr:50S ribosomal protein L29 [Parcubacteria group bacterium]